MMRPVNLKNTQRRVFSALNQLAGKRGHATDSKIEIKSGLPIGTVRIALDALRQRNLVSKAAVGWSIHDKVSVDIYGQIKTDDGRVRGGKR